MKVTRNKDTEVYQGFSLKDQNYLRKFDNAAADPEIQLFTEEELEDENEIEYYCALCKSKLDHLREGIDDTIWRCNNCMAYYDTNIQDLPLKNISSQRIRAYPEFEYYQEYDENDINTIFMQGIDADELGYQSSPKTVEILRDDNRVKHIKVRGSLVEALAAMNEMDIFANLDGGNIGQCLPNFLLP